MAQTTTLGTIPTQRRSEPPSDAAVDRRQQDGTGHARRVPRRGPVRRGIRDVLAGFEQHWSAMLMWRL